MAPLESDDQAAQSVPVPTSSVVQTIVSEVQESREEFADPKPSSEQLRAALKEKDIFAAARTAAAWIEGATLEEFRAFVRDPKRFPRMYVAGFDADFKKAFMDAFVERWLTLAPEDIDLIENNVQSGELIVAAVRAKPELVLAQLYPEEKNGFFSNFAARAFESLGRSDVAAARRILATVSTAHERKEFEFSILKGLADTDVYSAAALLPARASDQPEPRHASVVAAIVEAAERIGEGALRAVFAEAHGKLDAYPGMSRLLLRYPDLGTDLATRGAGAGKSVWVDQNLLRDADHTPAETRAQLLASYDQLPAAGRDQLCAALAATWARTEPRAAAEWAVAHAQPNEAANPANSAAQLVFVRWVNADPQAAFEWWQSLPASAMRDAIGMEASTRFAEEGDFETALQLFRPLPEKTLAQATEHFALLYAKRDPAAAASWLAKLPPEIAQNRAVGAVTSRYYNADPAATARWMEALEPGPMRDEAVKHFVRKSAQLDPVGATEWVNQIQDPKLLEQACVSIAFAWRFKDPEAMRAWVRNQPGMNEQWRDMFLRP